MLGAAQVERVRQGRFAAMLRRGSGTGVHAVDAGTGPPVVSWTYSLPLIPTNTPGAGCPPSRGRRESPAWSQRLVRHFRAAAAAAGPFAGGLDGRRDFRRTPRRIPAMSSRKPPCRPYLGDGWIAVRRRSPFQRSSGTVPIASTPSASSSPEVLGRGDRAGAAGSRCRPPAIAVTRPRPADPAARRARQCLCFPPAARPCMVCPHTCRASRSSVGSSHSTVAGSATLGQPRPSFGGRAATRVPRGEAEFRRAARSEPDRRTGRCRATRADASAHGDVPRDRAGAASAVGVHAVLMDTGAVGAVDNWSSAHFRIFAAQVGGTAGACARPCPLDVRGMVPGGTRMSRSRRRPCVSGHPRRARCGQTEPDRSADAAADASASPLHPPPAAPRRRRRPPRPARHPAPRTTARPLAPIPRRAPRCHGLLDVLRIVVCGRR